MNAPPEEEVALSASTPTGSKRPPLAEESGMKEAKKLKGDDRMCGLMGSTGGATGRLPEPEPAPYYHMVAHNDGGLRFSAGASATLPSSVPDAPAEDDPMGIEDWTTEEDNDPAIASDEQVVAAGRVPEAEAALTQEQEALDHLEDAVNAAARAAQAVFEQFTKVLLRFRFDSETIFITCVVSKAGDSRMLIRKVLSRAEMVPYRDRVIRATIEDMTRGNGSSTADDVAHETDWVHCFPHEDVWVVVVLVGEKVPLWCLQVEAIRFLDPPRYLQQMEAIGLLDPPAASDPRPISP